MLADILSGGSSERSFGSSDSSYREETDVQKLSTAYQMAVDKAVLLGKGPGALDQKVTTPVGEMSCGQFMIASSMDALIHGWDLAKATGQDTALDPEIVQICYNAFVPGAADQARAGGLVGPVVLVSENAGLQDKLLGYMGRRP